MAREEITPSEWLIMEVLWKSEGPMTSAEVIEKLKGSMSQRMVRVLMNRLNQKGVLGYTVDEHDSRVYHYSVMKAREECEREKSRKFVDNYFSGNQTNAVAALLQSTKMTREQIGELEKILEKSKGQDGK